MACVFLEIGQEVHIAGDLKSAVQEGVPKMLRGGWPAQVRRARPV